MPALAGSRLFVSPSRVQRQKGPKESKRVQKDEMANFLSTPWLFKKSSLLLAWAWLPSGEN
jgi:hypothetical protein